MRTSLCFQGFLSALSPFPPFFDVTCLYLRSLNSIVPFHAFVTGSELFAYLLFLIVPLPPSLDTRCLHFLEPQPKHSPATPSSKPPSPTPSPTSPPSCLHASSSQQLSPSWPTTTTIPNPLVHQNHPSHQIPLPALQTSTSASKTPTKPASVPPQP